MPKITRKLWKLTKDAIFPPVCINCGTSIFEQSKFLCDSCFDEIQMFSALHCPDCMARLANTSSPCHDCDYILAPASNFFPPIPALIHNFKYEGLIKIKTVLSAILIAHLKNLNLDLDEFVVTHVPLHPARKRKRGFDQSQILAKSVSDYFSLPQKTLLKRVKNNNQQAKQKDFGKRWENISGCFQVFEPEHIAGKKIILIDDVSTSGATLSEASAILKKYGAKKIIALVVAKA